MQFVLYFHGIIYIYDIHLCHICKDFSGRQQQTFQFQSIFSPLNLNCFLVNIVGINKKIDTCFFVLMSRNLRCGASIDLNFH